MTAILNRINGDKISEKTALITGSTGFIGRHLAEILGIYCNVVTLSRKGSVPGTISINADITDRMCLRRELKNHDFDIVFHVAGNTARPDLTSDLDYFLVNALGTRNILEMCRQKDIEQIIYSSSMEVFGNPVKIPVDETHPKVPATCYGLSKLMGESYCIEYSNNFGIPMTILRYSYVYGPGLPDFRVVSRFIANAGTGKPLLLSKRGKQSNDFVFVRDIVTANLLAVTHPKAFNQDFNIGSGKETTVEEIAKTVIQLIGGGKLHYLPGVPSRSEKFVFDITKARKMLKFAPVVSLKQGIQEQISYMIHSQ